MQHEAREHRGIAVTTGIQPTTTGQGTQPINHGRPVSHSLLWSPALQYGRPERLYTRGDASSSGDQTPSVQPGYRVFLGRLARPREGPGRLPM